MTDLPATEEVLERFRKADALVDQLTGQVRSIQDSANLAVGHERSLAEVAESTARLAAQLDGLRTEAATAYGALLVATSDAQQMLDHLARTAGAVSPEQIVRDLEGRLDALQQLLTEQTSSVLQPLQVELGGLHQLATQARDALGDLDLTAFLQDLDLRLQKMEEQTAQLAETRQQVDKLLAWANSTDGPRGTRSQHDAIQRQLRTLFVLVAFALAASVLTLAVMFAKG